MDKDNNKSEIQRILTDSILDGEREFYSRMLEDLKAQYKPKGVIEQILIERIVFCNLELLRVQKAETEYLKSVLNPRIVTLKFVNPKIVEEIVENEGYTPKIGGGVISKLFDIYAKFETAIENRLFKALRELERAQELRENRK